MTKTQKMKKMKENHVKNKGNQWKTRKSKENSGKPSKMKGKPLRTEIQKKFPKQLPTPIIYYIYIYLMFT